MFYNSIKIPFYHIKCGTHVLRSLICSCFFPNRTLPLINTNSSSFTRCACVYGNSIASQRLIGMKRRKTGSPGIKSLFKFSRSKNKIALHTIKFICYEKLLWNTKGRVKFDYQFMRSTKGQINSPIPFSGGVVEKNRAGVLRFEECWLYSRNSSISPGE